MVVGMAEVGQHGDEPLHEKEEGHPYPGHFGRAPTWGGSPTTDEMICFDGQDIT
jgi:hypothetical protein